MITFAFFKLRKYLNLYQSIGASVLAASIDIFGSMSNDLFHLIHILVLKASSRSLIPFEQFLPYWIRHLSMNYLRGNA